MARKINDDDFDEAMRFLRSAWHESEELSAIPEPSEDARETIVAAIVAALVSRGAVIAKETHK